MGRPEMVTVRLLQGRRRVGDELRAHVDWRDDHAELRRLLFDALEREGFARKRIGEFSLEVRRAGNDRHLTDFVATYDERRDR